MLLLNSQGASPGPRRAPYQRHGNCRSAMRSEMCVHAAFFDVEYSCSSCATISFPITIGTPYGHHLGLVRSKPFGFDPRSWGIVILLVAFIIRAQMRRKLLSVWQRPDLVLTALCTRSHQRHGACPRRMNKARTNWRLVFVCEFDDREAVGFLSVYRRMEGKSPRYIITLGEWD
ncbi:hypothetical protein L209DRAFT_188937 [Thermothelomyces heterothallicus CBS 203.75]